MSASLAGIASSAPTSHQFSRSGNLVLILLAFALILLLGPLFNVNGALFLSLDDSEDVYQQ